VKTSLSVSVTAAPLASKSRPWCVTVVGTAACALAARSATLIATIEAVTLRRIVLSLIESSHPL
jgi:hypothetical protein